MKYAIFLIALLSLFCIADDFEQSKEKEFWNTVAQFEKEFMNQKKAFNNLQKLYSLVKEFPNDLVHDELFVRKHQYLSAYSIASEIEEHYERNFHTFPTNHDDYLYLLADYIVLLSSIGKKYNSNRLIKELSNKKIIGSDAYALSVELYLNPRSQEFESLKKRCHNKCVFSIYYVSIMEYFKRNKKYDELEVFSKKLVSQLIKGKLIVSNMHFPQYVYSYLSLAAEKNSKKKFSAAMFDLAIDGISKDTYIYKQLIRVRHN